MSKNYVIVKNLAIRKLCNEFNQLPVNEREEIVSHTIIKYLRSFLGQYIDIIVDFEEPNGNINDDAFGKIDIKKFGAYYFLCQFVIDYLKNNFCKSKKYSLMDLKDSKNDGDIDDRFSSIIVNDFLNKACSCLSLFRYNYILQDYLLSSLVDFINYIYECDEDNKFTMDSLIDLSDKMDLSEEEYYERKMKELHIFFDNVNYLSELLNNHDVFTVYNSKDISKGYHSVSDLAYAYAKKYLGDNEEPNSGKPEIDEASKRMRVR